MKREVPLILTGVVGVVFIIQFFIPHEPFHSLADVFSDWFSIIESCAIWLGAFNLIKLSMDRLGRRILIPTVGVVSLALLYGIIAAPGFLQGQLPLILFLMAFLLLAAGQYSRSKMSDEWFLSFSTIVSFVLILIVGFGFSAGRRFLEPGTSFDYLYVNVYSPLSSTMFAMLAFFVASASYRAFRARNREATLLLLAAFFVMLGRVPLGDLMSSFMPEGARLSNFADWIMNFPNAAGQRAIMIGIALGIVSTSLRVILGIERSHLGGD
ncbi:MAG TPA: hypothetical protein VGB22_02115 [candidate division Zixibacteria bacterium]|jgi:hypothetical protein